jgi:hypothetical protein
MFDHLGNSRLGSGFVMFVIFHRLHLIDS